MLPECFNLSQLPSPDKGLVFIFNHKSTSSRQPRNVKFGMQAYFNQTRRNMKKKTRFRIQSHIITGLLPNSVSAVNCNRTQVGVLSLGLTDKVSGP
jgi:hypothetical protein